MSTRLHELAEHPSPYQIVLDPFLWIERWLALMSNLSLLW